MIDRRSFVAGFASILLVAGGPAASTAPASLLARSLADPARAQDRTQDARRHPTQLVALADLKPGQRVVDLIPGSGYWSRIFSRIVGPGGRVYGVWPQPYASEAAGDIQHLKALARQYGNIDMLVEPGTRLTAPAPVDVVWTSQNYHDYNDKFMGKPGSQSLARDAYRILKPGGLFIVIDHMATPGSGIRDTDTLHRIDRAVVVREATAAGFRLVGQSNVLANPRDPLTIKVFDPKIRGHTSQFALKFRKPAR
jgi:predicted methyltransferase